MLIGSRTVKTHYQMQGENLAMREVSDAAAEASEKKILPRKNIVMIFFSLFVFSSFFLFHKSNISHEALFHHQHHRIFFCEGRREKKNLQTSHTMKQVKRVAW